MKAVLTALSLSLAVGLLILSAPAVSQTYQVSSLEEPDAYCQYIYIDGKAYWVCDYN